MRPVLADMHVHLAWFRDPAKVAAELAARGVGALVATVTPREYERALPALAGCPAASVAVGAHPWWVADGRLGATDVERAVALARDAPFVGEVGLDFSPSHVPVGSEVAQVDALRCILRACDAGARAGAPKLLSLHAVRSVTAVLDLLEETGCATSCRCVFHWFSGTSDELHRAVRAGCSFSVNEMMLRTRRGREYARQLPPNRLLTETDLPPSERASLGAQDVIASLERTLEALAAIRGVDVRHAVAGNASALLDVVAARDVTAQGGGGGGDGLGVGARVARRDVDLR